VTIIGVPLYGVPGASTGRRTGARPSWGGTRIVQQPRIAVKTYRVRAMCGTNYS
jgi:hypothetical protein